MAAPVVGRMMADILPYLGYETVDNTEKNECVMPLLVNDSLSEASEKIMNAGLRYRTIGTGDTVTNQLPKAGTKIVPDSEILIYLGAEISPDCETVPDLNGMSFSDARDTLSALGIYMNTISPVSDDKQLIVCCQSISEGTVIKHGSVVEVTLIDSDETMLGKY